MTARYSLYTEVHKGIRSLMMDLVVRAGRTDFDQPAAVAALEQATRNAFFMLESHADHENRFIGPVVQKHAPAIAEEMFGDHHQQEEQLMALLTEVSELAGNPTDARTRGHRFVVTLSAVFGDMLVHMAEEEHVIMPALWEKMSDAELMAVEQQLLASIPPEKMGAFLSWMLPAMNHAERLGMLAGMRAHAPAEVFNGVRALAASVLSAEDEATLEAGLTAATSNAA